MRTNRLRTYIGRMKRSPKAVISEAAVAESGFLAGNLEDLFRGSPAGGPVLVVTLGNAMRTDDGIGPFIAGRIGRGMGHIALIDAGERPEDFLEEAVRLRPERTVIIDAADFAGRPGEVRLIPLESISQSTLSTHAVPPSFFAALLARDTGSPVCFLGIQAADLSLREEPMLSTEVGRSAGRIIRAIERAAAAQNQG